MRLTLAKGESRNQTSVYQLETIGLVPQGGSQKSKVKSQNEYSVGVSLIWNGLFISAALY
ncbi:hypothetical protein [Nostoc sp.]|uniref:hypothetical protein n=1 Tax=Nostoc sp. TaxID=1180 RepID=UPI002FF74140